MRILLLDTHVLLWWLEGGDRITRKAKTEIANNENLVFVSAASVWEMTIKKALGKLEVPENLDEEMERHQFTPLPITLVHAQAVGNLPGHHQDPFDRMLIAQAKAESLTLVTHDSMFKAYDIPIIRT